MRGCSERSNPFNDEAQPVSWWASATSPRRRRYGRLDGRSRNGLRLGFACGAPSHYAQGRACPRRDRLPGPARAARARRALARGQQQAERDHVHHRRPDGARPDRDAEDAGPDRSAGSELPARVRLDVALLPIAHHRPDRRVRAQPPRHGQHPATGRLWRVQRQERPAGLAAAGGLPDDPHRQDAERVRHGDERDLRPAGLGAVQRRRRAGRVLRLHQAPFRVHRLRPRRERGPRPVPPGRLPDRRLRGPGGGPDRRPLHEPLERPALHAGPVLRSARPGDPRDEVPERLRDHAAPDRPELQREERQGQARLDPEDLTVRSRADREDPDPLPAPARDAALGGRRDREDRQRALGQRSARQHVPDLHLGQRLHAGSAPTAPGQVRSVRAVDSGPAVDPRTGHPGRAAARARLERRHHPTRSSRSPMRSRVCHRTVARSCPTRAIPACRVLARS